MTTIQEKIAIMQAFADGKEIEGRFLHGNAVWYPCPRGPSWNWADHEYRVKRTFTPHKHADVIKAYAAGKRVQLRTRENLWSDTGNPCFFDERDYRIHPEDL